MDSWIMGVKYKAFDEYVLRTTTRNKRIKANWYVVDVVTLAVLVGTIAAIVLHEVWL